MTGGDERDDETARGPESDRAVEVPARRREEAPAEEDDFRRRLLLVVPLVMGAAAIVGVVLLGMQDKGMYSKNVDDLIKKQMAEGTSWSYRLINTESNSMTIISQNPGEGNREHYHPDWNEWWYILDGSWKWTIEGKDKIVSKGDVVFIPKGTVHRIEAVGDKPAIRMAVSRADVAHVYTTKQ